MNELSPLRRKKVEVRAAELVSEEMTLQELRRARKLTQARMARALHISQDGVSRLERRTDFLLSSLQKSIKAMGGSLSLIVEVPDREPVRLSASLARRRHSLRRQLHHDLSIWDATKSVSVTVQVATRPASRSYGQARKSRLAVCI
jgi:transcriptional regulator with XRE-family HTH domain